MKQIAFASLVVLLVSAPAQASFLLAIDVNGVQACASDNNAGCGFGTQLFDIDPTVGVMSFGNLPLVIGGLEITGSVQQATIGGPFNILNTSSTQITNISGGTISGMFAVSATGFTPFASTAFASGSATWQNAVGSSIQMGWYNDPLNAQGAQFATDTPGIELFTCSDSITLIADATACSNGPISVEDLNPFSMTLFTSFNLTSGATVVNRGQTEIKPVATDVPEPSALFLLGLSTMFVLARRKF